jgi:hypothetical protein
MRGEGDVRQRRALRWRVGEIEEGSVSRSSRGGGNGSIELVFFFFVFLKERVLFRVAVGGGGMGKGRVDRVGRVSG